MKFKCVHNKEWGYSTNADYSNKLTIGKIYQGQIEDVTSISRLNKGVILFNDQKEWKCYPLEFFEPVDQE
jgi:hypothetical protein